MLRTRRSTRVRWSAALRTEKSLTTPCPGRRKIVNACFKAILIHEIRFSLRESIAVQSDERLLFRCFFSEEAFRNKREHSMEFAFSHVCFSFAFLIFRDLLSVPPPPSNEENEAQMWPQRQPTSVLEKPAPRCSGRLGAKSRKHWQSPPPDKTAFLYREIGTQSVSLGPSFRAIICSHILQHRQSRGATSAASSDALGVSARRTGTLL